MSPHTVPVAGTASRVPRIVIMGVSGSGKSTVGRTLAQALGIDFLEGDKLHPPENVARMAAGVALTDDDRQGWLAAIAARLAQARREGRGLVVACSALKRSYREVLRAGAPDLRLVYLAGERALLQARTQAREGHFMPASLLGSQLDTLQEPDADEHALTVSIAPPPEAILAQLLRALAPDNVAPAPPSGAGASGDSMSNESFTQVILYTDSDGRARFREQAAPLSEGTPQSMLTPLAPTSGYQFRRSPPGYRSAVHCSVNPQWLFILRGQMEINLLDGSARVFKAGDHFYSDDRLPEGATFDPAVHGHWTRVLGDEPLETVFVRARI